MARDTVYQKPLAGPGKLSGHTRKQPRLLTQKKKIEGGEGDPEMPQNTTC